MRLFIFTLFCLFSNAFADMTITHLPGSIGVEIKGLDVKTQLSDEQIQQIRSLLLERLVVVIRNQELSAQEQVAFTKRFGDVEIAWDKKNRHPDDPCVHIITNSNQRLNANYKSSTFNWHWDKSFIKYPTNICIGYFPSKPQPEGYGQTQFINLYQAYEELPADIKEKLQGEQAVHSYAHMSELRQKNYQAVALNFQSKAENFSDVLHPLIRIHPVTKKAVLNLDTLSQSGIVGMDQTEFEQLQKQLLDHSTQERFQYAHDWQHGDLVLWDNLALAHRGSPSDPSIERILHRTNISCHSLYEGRALIIGMSELPANFKADKLFATPLIIYADLHPNTAVLAQTLQALKQGMPTEAYAPHSIVLVVGKSWKDSVEISHFIDFEAQQEDVIESFCLQKFLDLDNHLRLMCGSLDVEHLNRKLKLFVSSWETYFNPNTPAVLRAQREQMHAKILKEAFSHTSIDQDERAWLKWLQEKPVLSPATNKPWLLFLAGAQATGRTTLVSHMQESGIIESEAVVINTRLFFDHLLGKIPYLHKIKLWPVVYEEKKYLIQLITQLALANNLNVIIDTYILEESQAEALVRAAHQLGGHCSMLALSTPLNEAYKRAWNAARNKADFKDHLYEIILFHKICSHNLSRFVELFDSSVVIDHATDKDNLVFFSQGSYREIFNKDNLDKLLAEKDLDPVELTDKLLHCDEPEQLIVQELNQISRCDFLVKAPSA